MEDFQEERCSDQASLIGYKGKLTAINLPLKGGGPLLYGAIS